MGIPGEHLMLLPLLVVCSLLNCVRCVEGASGADLQWQKAVRAAQMVDARNLPTDCDITTHGAIGDNKTINTDAIITCMEKCHAVSTPGPAIVVIPNGQFLSGPINITSNTIIRLEEAAQLLGTQNVTAYPFVKAIYTSKGFIYNGLLSAYNQSNIAIVGVSRSGSIINGQGWNFFVNRLSKSGYEKGPRWHLHTVWSRNITISHMTITGPRDIGGTDGIDPASSQNVRIYDCFIDVGDDAISVKAVPYYWFPTLHMMPSEDIHISQVNLVARNFAVGAHCKAGIRNVLFEDSQIGDPVQVTSAWAIKIKCADGYPSVVENIVMRNLRLGRIGSWSRYPDTGLGFITSLRYGEDDDVDEGSPSPDVHPLVRNVTLANVTAVSVTVPGIIYGIAHTFLQEYNLINVTLPNTTRPWVCGSVNVSNSIAENVTPPLDWHQCKD